MRFPGTISVSDATLASVLEDAARSFKQHGFRTICFIGEHGGSQDAQKRVAEKLNAEWNSQGVKVVHVDDYYKDNGQVAWAAARGVKAADPAAHAGLFDTSEMLYLRPQGVRKAYVTKYGEEHFLSAGVAGDPQEARKEYGEKLLSLKVNAAVKQIRNAEKRR
jgi:creatinine amidohydrolase/Fe(II)-dependent formamide hydrolase-like protein